MRVIFDGGYRKSVNALVYALLAGVTYNLLDGIILEFLEGKTDFAVSKQPVEIEDNPAVLLKFEVTNEIKYGIDYNVTVKERDRGSSQDFTQNPNDYLLYHDRQDNITDHGNFGINHQYFFGSGRSLWF